VDKRRTADEAIAELSSGMTIGIGGWGSRRKPMALIRAILRSSLTDLTVVSYAGPDVGLLLAAGRVRKLVYGFASLDSIALEPHFRRARQTGSIEAVEWDEGMLQLGLRAAAQRLPFLPTRAGLGSDVLRFDPTLKTVRSPYPGPDGEPEDLVAVPALPLDAALIHAHCADAKGNCRFTGPDPYFDVLFARAAARTYVSCERILSTAEWSNGSLHTPGLARHWVHAVVEAPGGAAFTSCDPEYPRDEATQRAYAVAAKAPDEWKTWLAGWMESTP
jgi:glutaconate CoA-transferase subunit A